MGRQDQRTDLIDRAEAVLRAELFDADGNRLRETCSACDEPVADVRAHAEKCWRLRMMLGSGMPTLPDIAVLRDPPQPPG